MSPRLFKAAALLASVSLFYGFALSSEIKRNPKRPPRDWERALDTGPVPKGLKTIRAEECGRCHTRIYREWKRSTHARAWQDFQFQEELKKNRGLFVCINCHTPLQRQQDYLVEGLQGNNYLKPIKRPNPDFDPVLKEESITCAVCHVRDGYVIGPYNTPDAPHATRKDPKALSEELCFRCHNVYDELSPQLICVFRTGDEWLAGPYSGKGITCISCHMPEVKRPLADGTGARKTRRHLWARSGIAKFIGEERQVAQDSRSGMQILITPSTDQAAPGETVYLGITYSNQKAGHHLPTGDPERFIMIECRVETGSDKVILKKEWRVGQKWEWTPAARKLSDNSLKPLEARTKNFSFTMPKGKGVWLKVTVTNHRIIEEFAREMNLIGRYPLKAAVLEKRLWIPAKH
ncbi:MAG: multiheme c-type cytochrome [bacterium]